MVKPHPHPPHTHTHKISLLIMSAIRTSPASALGSSPSVHIAYHHYLLKMENLETVIWESGLQTDGVESGPYSTQLPKSSPNPPSPSPLALLLMVIIMLLMNLLISWTHLGFLGAPAIKGNHQVMGPMSHRKPLVRQNKES